MTMTQALFDQQPSFRKCGDCLYWQADMCAKHGDMHCESEVTACSDWQRYRYDQATDAYHEEQHAVRAMRIGSEADADAEQQARRRRIGGSMF